MVKQYVVGERGGSGSRGGAVEIRRWPSTPDVREPLLEKVERVVRMTTVCNAVVARVVVVVVHSIVLYRISKISITLKSHFFWRVDKNLPLSSGTGFSLSRRPSNLFHDKSDEFFEN